MPLLSQLPVLAALPLYALLFAGVAVATHVVFRYFVPPAGLKEQHDVAGYLVAVVGVLYSVVLGFLVGTVWTGFESAQQTTDLEAGYVADAFNFAARWPEPQHRQLQQMIARYALDVQHVELPPSGSGGEDLRAPELIRRAIDMTVTMPPPKTANAAAALENNTLRSALLGSLRNIGDARRLRQLQSKSRLPAGMLEALILGAMMVLAFVFLFGVENVVVQMAMTGLIAGSIGLFFGLVLELSTPYSGAIHVSGDAWTYVSQNNHLADYAR